MVFALAEIKQYSSIPIFLQYQNPLPYFYDFLAKGFHFNIQ